ncbi:MAG: hypothetical protein M1305_02635 [Candidatus Marsarchaeota archaeon]|nr:hypothetical protein [Candidatus Marsarchaeota archaeon]
MDDLICQVCHCRELVNMQTNGHITAEKIRSLIDEAYSACVDLDGSIRLEKVIGFISEDYGEALIAQILAATGAPGLEALVRSYLSYEGKHE